MNIDIELLKTDPDYWDEVGGKGADAYCAKINRQHFHNDKDFCSDCIPRPTKKQWDGTGLPPVGVKCEGKHSMTTNGWFECVVNAYKDDKVWFTEYLDSSVREFVYPVSVIEFRPIKSPRERAIEAGLSKLDLRACKILRFENAVERVVGQLVDAGWKPPEDSQ